MPKVAYAPTLALGCGLRGNATATDKRGRIHSYDLFRANRYVSQFLPGYPEGTSTRPYYDAAIAGVATHVTVHEGDITTSPSPASRPIEIFFVDVAKRVGTSTTSCCGTFSRT